MTSHLLLIEDDDIAAYVTCKLLESTGFTASVDVVRNAMEAMAYLACEGAYANRKSGNPVLILLDLKLPDLDGFELFKLIRSNPTLAAIPIFILSASNTDQDICRSVLLGVSKYLIKPLNTEEFRQEASKVVHAAPSIH
ncbi:response regulator [Noviherbaspirillum galbum]|uniref:Response regulator n=1 Tax=Noviherbaspirillum galbum TaxID=2709383 RepID=A0A6B3SQV9_9BURK|nr:response regulator [Noviherbaspirillum galbum]NEX63143.1 response regulator [Noviherbaspirillum galbum]